MGNQFKYLVYPNIKNKAKSIFLFLSNYPFSTRTQCNCDFVKIVKLRSWNKKIKPIAHFCINLDNWNEVVFHTKVKEQKISCLHCFGQLFYFHPTKSLPHFPLIFLFIEWVHLPFQRNHQKGYFSSESCAQNNITVIANV